MSQLLPERRSRLATERWEPFSELEQVTERLRRMLDQSFGGLADHPALKLLIAYSPAAHWKAACAAP